MVSSTLRIPGDSVAQAVADAMKGTRRHVMIVGASRGIGESLARQLGTEPETMLTLASRSYNRLTGLRMDIGSDRVHATRLDLSDDESIDECVASALDHHGPPDALVITAGSHRMTQLSDTSVKGQDSFLAVMRVNLMGPWFLAQQMATHMPANGSIVFFGNGGARTGMPGRHAHAAAKTGLVALTRGMARELGARNIRVNIVEPGLVDTELGRSLIGQRAGASKLPVEELTRRMVRPQMLRRLVRPDEVAEYVRFLIGPGGTAVTGQIIDVSCGGHTR